MILVRGNLEFNLTSLKADDNRPYIIIDRKSAKFKIFVRKYLCS